jgi:predicted nucleic acid-binding protein
MKVLLDTNIVVDIISRRAGYEDSLRVLQYCETKQITGYVSAITITDVTYILRKYIAPNKVRQALQTMAAVIDIADVTKKDIAGAFGSGMKDFEDAVQAECAKRIGADYIITRNLKDFAKSPVQAVSPAKFTVRSRPAVKNISLN